MDEGFTMNERVIWDSGFGYELGYYLGYGTVYNTHLIDIITGRIQEPTSLPKTQIHKYSNELVDTLTLKYGYEKRFSESF